MENDHDMDLLDLFAEVPEPPQDEVFVQRVTRGVRLLRYTQRATRVFLLLAGLAALGLLKPWLTSLAGYAAPSSGLFTHGVMAVIASPAGWAIGGGLALPFLLKTVLSRS